MEVGAAAAGFVALTITTVQLFQSCVQAFEFFYTAQHIGAAGDTFVTRLAWEQYRLMQWGARAGLGPGQSPNDRLSWQIAQALLLQLESFLTSAEKLKSKYHFDVEEEQLEYQDQGAISGTQLTSVGRIIARLKPDLYTTKARIIQASNGSRKRLRWATIGKMQANAIIKDISDLNMKLDRLLDTTDQEKQAKVNELLLRDMLSRSSTASEIEHIQQILSPSSSVNLKAIQAAATLKQIRLVVGTDTRDDEIRTTVTKQTQQNMPSITKWKYKKLSPYIPNTPLTYKGIEFARYDQKPVLVEWKVAEGPMWKRLIDQVRYLAVMLASPAGKDSHSLLCTGYLPWEERELYALVFDIPSSKPSKSLESWSLRTLHDLIGQQPYLSLTRRVRIAQQMAQVVLQLHTAGWLHKSLRSENIIFLAPNGSSANEFLQQVPYLVGYDYARPDTAQAAMFTQLPDTQLNADLYRHPQARGIQREKYRKEFDMYSLGCVLLELALWQNMLDISTKFFDNALPEQIKEATRTGKILDLPTLLDFDKDLTLIGKVHHCGGEVFAEAIKLSVSMGQPKETETSSSSLIDKMSTSGDTEVDEGDVSLDIQQAVVDKLRDCSC